MDGPPKVRALMIILAGSLGVPPSSIILLNGTSPLCERDSLASQSALPGPVPGLTLVLQDATLFEIAVTCDLFPVDAAIVIFEMQPW